MYFPTVFGKVTLRNGEVTPGASKGWRAVAFAPIPQLSFRPVWHVNRADEYESGHTTYQMIWPGDVVLLATEDSQKITAHVVNANRGADPEVGRRVEDLLCVAPMADVIGAWLLDAGRGNGILPPGAGWDGRFSALAQRRADKIRRVFNGAPSELVERLAYEGAPSLSPYAPDWEQGKEIPWRLDPGYLWICWTWAGPAVVIDTVGAQQYRPVPPNTVKIARVDLGADYVEWELFNNSLEG